MNIIIIKNYKSDSLASFKVLFSDFINFKIIFSQVFGKLANFLLIFLYTNGEDTLSGLVLKRHIFLFHFLIIILESENINRSRRCNDTSHVLFLCLLIR